MDMLYHRYACPFEFMRPYIEQGRFDEFVNEVIELENKRREEQAEKEDEDKMWTLYVHSADRESFIDWKKRVLGGNAKNRKPNSDNDLNDDKIKSIYSELFPDMGVKQNDAI